MTTNKDKDMVFGIQSVIESLKSDKEIDKVLVQRELGSSNKKITEITELAKDRNVYVSKVPLGKLNKITRKNHQGVIAFVSPVQFISLNHIIPSIYEKGEIPLILILDRITDVRNFGAVCRTAECAGVHAIVIPSKGAAPISSDAMKTSSGALNFIPVCKENNLLDTVTFLQESGLQIVACTEKTDSSLYKVDFKGPTAVIMGSEENGISSELLRRVNFLGKIPLLGNISSLNISVATGIIIYEAVRQRNL